jgi:hypothetical protein
VIRRVLVAPLNASHRQRGQVEAFEQIFGPENVAEFDWLKVAAAGEDAGAKLVARAGLFAPDWVWIQAQGAEALAPWRVRQLRERLPDCVVTHWMGDCRRQVSDQLAAMCTATHGTLVSNTGQLGMFRRAGAAHVAYLQIGLDPEDMPITGGWVPPFRVPDVVFIGNYYGHVDQFGPGTELRLQAVRALTDAGIDVGVVGGGWPSTVPVVGGCHVKQQCGVYARAKVALSINHFNDIPRYYSDRHLIALASGTAVAAKRVPELEEEFRDGIDCMMWDTTRELVEVVRRLLGDEELRRRVGATGQALAWGHHTWVDRIRGILPTIEAWRQQECVR